MKKDHVLCASMVGLAFTAAQAADPVRLSHSVEEFLVVVGTAVACASSSAPQTTNANQYWRSFTLADFGITDAVTISTLEVGIETIRLPVRLEVDVTFNLYQAPAGTAPAFGLELIGSSVVTLTERSAEVVTIDVTGVVDAGRALIVEVNVPNLRSATGELTGDVYFPGANPFGQTAPSYLSSAPCGITTPTDYAFIGAGFPDVHLVLIAVGETGGGTGCRADMDGDGALTIFDFLTFQNLFAAQDPRADFDGDGQFTIFDFLTFQNEFAAGC